MTIVYDEKHRLFSLTMSHSLYAFGINRDQLLQHLYWGEAIRPEDCAALLKPWRHSSFDSSVEREQEEYTGWGGMVYWEPCLKVKFANGVRDLRLGYKSHSIGSDGGKDHLVVTLKDQAYEVEVDVHYVVFAEYDLIERYCTIRNTGSEPVVLENVQSAVWSLPGFPNSRLTYVSGRWAGEDQLKTCVLTEGKKVLECRKGFTGTGPNPWFAIDDGFANEEYGRVWFGALAWSGNWKIVTELTPFQHIRVTGGVHDFDFAWLLNPGEAFETPVFTGGYTGRGFGAMSRQLHRYERAEVLPQTHAHEPRKVLYNSWEATTFNVQAEEQKKLADKAAALGVELFVIDDGWFGQRHSDKAGLGDWYVNREKFPHGLADLIDHVHALGMEFGLWVEPEMVNPDSDLYRQHPDWVYRFAGREGTLGRNQLVLNLAKEEVKQFVLEFMTKLLSEHPIKFIKWDFNRPITEPGWMEAPESQQREVWVRHVRHFYEIWEQLRLRFPEVVFEACAGGGGRVDLGIMNYADQFWTSDNTDALDRLRIQEGHSYVYCPRSMMCWVTESPNYVNRRELSLPYRFHSAMMGSLGIGADLNKWSEQEMEEAAALVAQYKEIRHLVQDGDLYRLYSPRLGDYAAVQYVDKDRNESVVFVMSQVRHYGNQTLSLCLQGLDPDKLYEVEADETITMSGGGLMQIGLSVSLKGDFQSKVFKISQRKK